MTERAIDNRITQMTGTDYSIIQAPMGWIEIQVEEGVGTGKVVLNDVYPERVGREILKDLQADDTEQGLWRGQIYAERLGEYKDAEIALPEPGQMKIKVKVGFISRTVEWIRVDEVPRFRNK